MLSYSRLLLAFLATALIVINAAAALRVQNSYGAYGSAANAAAGPKYGLQGGPMAPKYGYGKQLAVPPAKTSYGDYGAAASTGADEYNPTSGITGGSYDYSGMQGVTAAPNYGDYDADAEGLAPTYSDYSGVQGVTSAPNYGDYNADTEGLSPTYSDYSGMQGVTAAPNYGDYDAESEGLSPTYSDYSGMQGVTAAPNYGDYDADAEGLSPTYSDYDNAAPIINPQCDYIEPVPAPCDYIEPVPAPCPVPPSCYRKRPCCKKSKNYSRRHYY